MQIKIFIIPIYGGEEELSEMNKFLRTQRISEVNKTFVAESGILCWSFCVTYLPKSVETEEKKGKIDYKNVLDEQTFARFSEMRNIRKELSNRDAIPSYAVFTDAELAEIAKLDVPNLQSIKNIPGIGQKKVEKYGRYFCENTDETSRKFDGENIRL